ncbi:MAG: thiolase family protein [Proteobacteria bacterium]|nr:thiolase family protein [Pseudomonadota bacterium]
MREAVIVSACRTAVGRAPRGKLCKTRPDEMGAAALTEVLKRTPGLDPVDIDDVVIGCSFPEAEQGLNVARVLVARAGLPDDVSGVTVNRFCSSGLQAISHACERIMVGAADVIVAGGVETMSMIPMGGNTMSVNPMLGDTRPSAYEGMGMTAENVAEKYDVSRQDQDRFGYESQMKAARAVESGHFKDQIVPLTIEVQNRVNGQFVITEEIFDIDEGVRADTTLEGLAALRPAFRKTGTVTAGNSSQMSDGAAMVVCMTKDQADRLGLTPMATYRGYQVAGVDPLYMGEGPIKAIPKLFERTGIKMGDLKLIELNEAFASQALACIRTLDIPTDITNPNGGAIALGHPLGCTGAKLTTQLLYEMARQDMYGYGLVSMCIGFGMGAAGVFEREKY